MYILRNVSLSFEIDKCSELAILTTILHKTKILSDKLHLLYLPTWMCRIHQHKLSFFVYWISSGFFVLIINEVENVPEAFQWIENIFKIEKNHCKYTNSINIIIEIWMIYPILKYWFIQFNNSYLKIHPKIWFW